MYSKKNKKLNKNYNKKKKYKKKNFIIIKLF